jgi:protein-S-isoprenylcysteine O-methyltransferase Ste14
MGLDIRWPIGLMFALIGALLLIMGLVTGPTSQSLGYNINLWWGLLLFVFGGLMTFFAHKAGKKAREDQPLPPAA